ncbi:MAG: hypothetical protein D6767_01115 [Candidatus Hydrogenedentota bacterium]|nr:MAG: hypothetical protein D6767_01115 [Candidatus Hydrogenedentota bacterium]
MEITDIDLSTHGVIEASAGTGKTYTLERLVIRFLLEEKLSISEILVVTFTNKAATEMKERIRNLLQKSIKDNVNPITEEQLKPEEKASLQTALLDFENATISTIHSFSQRMLNDYSFQVVFEGDPEEIQEEKIFAREFYKFFMEQEDCGKLYANCDEKLKKVKQNLNEIIKSYQPEFNKEIYVGEGTACQDLYYKLAKAWKPYYKEYKIQRNLADFSDLLINLREELKKPDFLNAVQKRFKVAIIDEFQDTDPIQWEIFEKIFTNQYHKLFLIGDPKQSIYGFRGADVENYNKAQNKLVEELKGKKYVLDTCYRSHPELIDFFNALFQEEPEKENYFLNVAKYQEIQAPKNSQKNFIDPVRQKRVTLIDYTSKDHEKKLNLPTIRKTFAEFAVREIKKLREKNPALKLSEIAFLFRSGTSISLFQEILEKYGFPVAIRETSIFDSEEADQMRLIAEAVFTLQEKQDSQREGNIKGAFVSEIFRLSYRMDFLPADFSEHPGFRILEKLSTLQFPQQLADWFYILYEETGFFSTLLEQEENTVRKQNNYAALEEAVLEARPENLWDLIQLFKGSERKKSSPGDEDKIQILTMHAAKGLEFQVVFVPGFLDSLVNTKQPYYEYQKDNKVVIDVSKSKDKKEDRDKFVLKETRRLVYVALTRAKSLLYLARSLPSRNNDPIGFECFFPDKVSPFLNIIPYSDLENMENLPPAQEEARSFSFLEQLPNQEKILPEVAPVLSYSSLKSGTHESSLPRNDDDTSFDPEEFGGSWYGSYVHEVLEKIPLNYFHKKALSDRDHQQKVKEEMQEIALTYQAYLYRGQRVEALRDNVFDLLQNALNTPFLEDMCLADLSEENLFKEEKFFMPYSLAKQEEYFQGFVDLLFVHENKIYLCDYKTNRLPAYDKASLSESIRKEKYHWQYSLYAKALLRFLNQFTKLSFGGVYYFYLRGMMPEKPEGVYFTALSQDEIEKNLNEIEVSHG